MSKGGKGDDPAELVAGAVPGAASDGVSTVPVSTEGDASQAPPVPKPSKPKKPGKPAQGEKAAKPAKLVKTPKAAKPAKLVKTPNAADGEKLATAAKAVTSPKPAKAAQIEKSPKPSKPANAPTADKAPKATKPAKADKAPKAAKIAKAEKAPKAAKPPKAEKAAKPAKAEKAAKPAKAAKSAKAAKPGKAAKRRETTVIAPGVASLPASFVDQAGQLAAAAGAILGEVAGLVRQAAEPAAGRIAELVARTVESRKDADKGGDHPASGVAQDARVPRPRAAAELSPGSSSPGAVSPGPALAAGSDEVPPPPVSAAVDPDTGLDIAADPATLVAVEPPLEVQPGARVAAAIDVGTTSVHLLVAAVGNHRVVPMLDESVFLGLGERIATDARFGPAVRDSLAEAVTSYVDAARQLGADPITVVGTEPMRRADDSAAAVHAVMARSGVAFHVVDHDEEGLLTLLGVTGGRPLAASTLVVDIGGGSSEIVVTEPDGTVLAGGLPLGAAQLTRELVHADPPSPAEIDALRARIREEVAQLPDLRPGEIVAVGGTASNLLKLLPATAIDRMLTRRRITVALAMLTVERSVDAAERHLIRPERARILPAGALIVDAILERFGADRLRVSEDGIRSGLLLATTAAGGAWRDGLPRLAGGWESSPLD